MEKKLNVQRLVCISWSFFRIIKFVRAFFVFRFVDVQLRGLEFLFCPIIGFGIGSCVPPLELQVVFAMGLRVYLSTKRPGKSEPPCNTQADTYKSYYRHNKDRALSLLLVC